MFFASSHRETCVAGDFCLWSGALATGVNNPRETPEAAQAFADYVAMLPGERSLEALAKRYQSDTKPVPTKRLSTIKTWSTKHRWQARIVEATTALTEERLRQAAEEDAESFRKFSRLISLTADMAMQGKIILLPQDLVKLRESVRKPQAKGATNVSVQLDISLTQAIERIAEEDGLTSEERKQFEADVQELLAASK